MSSKERMESIRDTIVSAASALQRERDPLGFAQDVAWLVSALEQQHFALLSAEQGQARTPEDRLYYRAVTDCGALQEQLARIRSILSDKALTVSILQRKGHELDSMQQHLALVGAMDQALQHLIHLMQYDTPDRQEIDIRQGFRLTSGSMSYGHFFFATPQTSSDN